VTALWVHHQNLPVEVEKHLESGIVRLRHALLLSH
jgi:hypothetical protein